MNRTEWNALCTAADAADFYQFTMGAEENAQQTIYVDKSAPEAEYVELCIGSLEGLLADSDDTAAHAFFRANGVRF